MRSDPQVPPGDLEIEVSLFGPGFGEALALHLGQRCWVLIDSCLNPQGEPASLSYLRGLHQYQPCVERVVVTHWHDDHIRGVSELTEEYPEAKVVIPAALGKKEFRSLVGVYRRSPMMASSGLSEFVAILEQLQARRSDGRRERFATPLFAVPDRLLISNPVQTPARSSVPVGLYSLSPADARVVQAQLAFSQLMPSASSAKLRVSAPKDNHTSIAMALKVGERSVLLGADLERTTDPRTGWTAIIDDSAIIQDLARADVFKIPHHGSETGYVQRIWEELVDSPLALLTPFNRGKKPLPTADELVRIHGRTKRTLLTARPRTKALKSSSSAVQKMIDLVTGKTAIRVHHGWGHLRLRRRIDAVDWRVEMFGDAWELPRETT